MVLLLLIIIYLSFISLGLPDSLLGSAWPTIKLDLGVPVSYAGIISMIISCGTVISSLFSHRVIKKLGTAKVTTISVLMTAVSLWGFSISSWFWMLILWAIPYGLGAGAVDTALNNFVALHFKAKHMSWLHCFWGIGASIGPYIMGYCISVKNSWHNGFFTISIIQFVLSAILILSLPLWKINNNLVEEQTQTQTIKIKEVFKIKHAKPVLIMFFCYCALETTTGLWGSTYLNMSEGVSVETSAKFASLFYLGITIGRFISGFITMKLSNNQMIRLGQGIIFLGILMLLLPFGSSIKCAGLLVVGLGCAPIYPSMIHNTPTIFGKENSQAIIGMQMAFAYIGSMAMPPIFGLIANHINIKLYPIYLAIFLILMFVCINLINKDKKIDNEV